MTMMIIAILLATVAPESEELGASIRRLVDGRTSPYTLLEHLREDNSDDAIVSALVPLLRTDAGFEEHQARVRGFTMLLLLGMQADGKRRYTSPAQRQLFYDELQREEPSSIQVQIIQDLSSIPVDQRPMFMALLPSKLRKPDYSLVNSSLQAMWLYGEEGTPGLVEARELLVDPAAANPVLMQGLEQALLDEDEKARMIHRLRSAAAMARIALGALAEDLALYAQLDEKGQAAAARGVLMLMGCGCRDTIPGTVDQKVQALGFAINFYTAPDRIAEMPREVVGALQRLTGPSVDQPIRTKTIDGLKVVAETHPDLDLRAHVRQGLISIGALPPGDT